ncbi:hypothetical protein D3C81_642900 [compost metagenome]
MISYTRFIGNHKSTNLTPTFGSSSIYEICSICDSSKSFSSRTNVNKALGLCSSISDLIIGKIFHKLGSSQFITDPSIRFSSHTEWQSIWILWSS